MKFKMPKGKIWIVIGVLAVGAIILYVILKYKQTPAAETIPTGETGGAGSGGGGSTGSSSGESAEERNSKEAKEAEARKEEATSKAQMEATQNAEFREGLQVTEIENQNERQANIQQRKEVFENEHAVNQEALGATGLPAKLKAAEKLIKKQQNEIKKKDEAARKKAQEKAKAKAHLKTSQAKKPGKTSDGKHTNVHHKVTHAGTPTHKPVVHKPHPAAKPAVHHTPARTKPTAQHAGVAAHHPAKPAPKKTVTPRRAPKPVPKRRR